ncbi:hypothetical protein UMM65_16590 [Aureibaculum sp. 2210JD6-5]|uniref:hypothetical protein n=1 Tax=Aureibaculum sp. 2210JD6-5 TaxID=3103957 RepID=UPI002AAC8BBF|nr:hypothetical protein [Aureibaculum sp. 2210JD6-5]MDY7396866.1 hypothetical protein [Aureibaculum sp. 2210JD6-5]
MENINYIKHLNAVLELFSKDNRLNPSHISLYMALFQIWNNYRFKPSFYINRGEVMDISKLGSKSTYHRSINELSYWKYILYEPSHNPFRGSKIKLFHFGTTCEQALYPSHTNFETTYEQVVVSEDKHIKTGINKTNRNKLDQPKNENEVVNFFKKKKWPTLEAKKFYNHYQGIGWKVGGKSKIVDWKATAKSWILKGEELKTKKTATATVPNTDNLEISSNKNYNQPL